MSLAQPVMRPPPSLASYLQNMGQEPATQVQQQGMQQQGVQQQGVQPPTQQQGPNSGVAAAAQREVNKFKALQEKRVQLTQELQALDMQLTRTQGALEVFQAMGIIRPG